MCMCICVARVCVVLHAIMSLRHDEKQMFAANNNWNELNYGMRNQSTPPIPNKKDSKSANEDFESDQIEHIISHQVKTLKLLEK